MEGVFPQRMDPLDRENSYRAIGQVEDYIRYMTERVEFAVTNHARNLRKQGVGLEEIAAAVAEQGDKVANLSAQLAVVGAAVNTMADAVEDLDLRVRALEATGTYPIALKQTGSGEPAPDNPRPILPGLTLVRDDDSVLEVYGGELDADSGVLTVTHKAVELDGTESWSIAWGDSNPALYTFLANPADGVNNSGVFSRFPYANVYSTAGVGAKCYLASVQYRFICRFDGQPETIAEWKALLAEWAEDGKPLQAVYPLAEAVEIQLTKSETRRALRRLLENQEEGE